MEKKLKKRGEEAVPLPENCPPNEVVPMIVGLNDEMLKKRLRMLIHKQFFEVGKFLTNLY